MTDEEKGFLIERSKNSSIQLPVSAATTVASSQAISRCLRASVLTGSPKEPASEIIDFLLESNLSIKILPRFSLAFEVITVVMVMMIIGKLSIENDESKGVVTLLFFGDLT